MDANISPSFPETQSNSRLSRQDWIDAAYAAVVEGGFSAVRVLTLAEAIGVTRGSFYWHFSNQAELVDALVERWCVEEAQRMQTFSTARSADPKLALMSWVDALTHSAPGSDYPHVRFGLALRAFARRHAPTALRLAEVDKTRFAVLHAVFQELCTDPAAARKFAMTYYLALGGMSQALGVGIFNASIATDIRDSIADVVVQAASLHG